MERGFDKLMTPMGVALVTMALFMFFVIIAAGGVIWRIMERDSRAKEARKRADLAVSDPDGNNLSP